jgi:Ran GTPase-activating protein (RanGAP) involved in mRNA processing and transport
MAYAATHSWHRVGVQRGPTGLRVAGAHFLEDEKTHTLTVADAAGDDDGATVRTSHQLSCWWVSYFTNLVLTSKHAVGALHHSPEISLSHVEQLTITSDCAVAQQPEALCTVLRRSRQALRRLVIKDNDLSHPRAAEQLLALIPTVADVHRHTPFEESVLTNIVLENCGITGRGAEILSEVLRSLKYLEALSLAHNHIDDLGAAHVGRSIKELRNLRRLDIEDNDIEGLGGAEIISALSDSGACKTLNFSRNRIGCTGTVQFSDALRALRGVQDFFAESNELGPDGTMSLLDSLCHMDELTQLDIANNACGPLGAASLSFLLPRVTQLRALNIAGNVIGPRGAAALSPSLPQLVRLEALDLRGNELCCQGMVHLCSALQLMPTIRTLRLDDNLLGDTGAVIVGLDLLPQLTSLESIGLQVNGITDVGVVSACKGQWCPALQHVNIDGNRISERGAILVRTKLSLLKGTDSVPLR